MYFCGSFVLFFLPLGVEGWVQFVIMAYPWLFQYFFDHDLSCLAGVRDGTDLDEPALRQSVVFLLVPLSAFLPCLSRLFVLGIFHVKLSWADCSIVFFHGSTVKHLYFGGYLILAISCAQINRSSDRRENLVSI